FKKVKSAIFPKYTLLIVIAIILIEIVAIENLVSFDKTIYMVLIGTVLTFPIHEGLHYIVAKILGYNPTFRLTSIILSEVIKKNHFLLMSIAPLVRLTTVCISLILLNSEFSFILYVILILNTAGSNNDIKQFLSALKFPKNSFVFNGVKGELRAYIK